MSRTKPLVKTQEETNIKSKKCIYNIQEGTMRLSEIIKIWTKFSPEVEFTTFKILFLKYKCLERVKEEYNKKFKK